MDDLISSITVSYINPNLRVGSMPTHIFARVFVDHHNLKATHYASMSQNSVENIAIIMMATVHDGDLLKRRKRS
jgi:hypothetical protein